MDGLLIVDKPSGPTSHDVVARVRRAIGERRVGHTGTLDPLASGVLPLVIGRATRLAQLLSGSDKEYIAGIELGLATDTHDVTGQPLGAHWDGRLPDAAEIDTALNRFRGTFLQQPPVFSAKKINGRRSYRIARRPAGPDETGIREQADIAAIPARVPVTVHLLDLLNTDGARLTLRVRCSAGFYVRSLAHDLGQELGTGAHLVSLQRTESAGVRLEAAVPLAVIEQGGAAAAAAALTPMAQMVPALPAVALTDQGVRHARFGRELGPSDSAAGFPAEWRSDACPPQIRLLDPDGRLVGLARPASTPGLLHPAVILM
jgi:tRNA pseudouridine55 synthase